MLKQWITLKARSDWLPNSVYHLLFTSEQRTLDLRPNVL